MNGLLKYNYADPDATGVAHNNIDNILAENQANTLSELIKTSGSIGPQPDYAIEPTENMPGITKEMSNKIADMAMGSGSALKLLRPMAGKVATNLIRPAAYSVQDKINIIKHVYKKDGIKGLLKSIIKDEPIYTDEKVFGALVPKRQSLPTAREVPYRMMFDLPPRHGKAAYSNMDEIIRQNNSGSFDIAREISFNPKTVMGNRQLRNVVEEVEFPAYGNQRSHDVMGDFLAKRRRDLPSGEVTGLDYEDVWDVGFRGAKDRFKLKDWKKWAKQARKVKKSYGVYPKDTKDEAGSQLMRILAESITNPVTIKGTVPKSIYDDVVKKLGTKLTDDDMMKILQKVAKP